MSQSWQVSRMSMPISYHIKYTHGRLQVETTEECFHRSEFAYLTTNLYAPPGSTVPFALPRGVIRTRSSWLRGGQKSWRTGIWHIIFLGVRREIFNDTLRGSARPRVVDKARETRKAEVSIVVGSTSGRWTRCLESTKIGREQRVSA